MIARGSEFGIRSRSSPGIAGRPVRYEPNRRVVEAVSLGVAEGEVLAVLGPSGCGKSTILRLIAGLERPQAGQIRLDGVPVNERDPPERDVAMVFQSYALYPHMTVMENVAVPLRFAKFRRKRSGSASRRRLACWGSRGCSPAPHASFPEENGSGSRSRGRWCGDRSCSFWMSRCPIWTPS